MRWPLRTLFIVLIVVALSGLALLLTLLLSSLLAVSWLPDTVETFVRHEPWVLETLAGVLGLLALALLACLLVVIVFPRRSDVYIMERDAGKLEISRRSIESAAEHVMAGIANVRVCSARVLGSPKPGKTKLRLRAELDRSASFVVSGEEIQETVRREMTRTLGIAPDCLLVRMSTFFPKEQPIPKPKERAERKSSRVT